MAQQFINIGASPNDRTGDSLRVGGAKINANFSELYTLNSTLAEVAFSGDYNDLVNTPGDSGGGDGNVKGPNSSTDNEVVLFDGATGELIKGGGILGDAAFMDVGTSGSDVASGNRGVPSGGSAGQVLAKVDGDDYSVEWVDQTGGGSGDGDVEGPDGGVLDSDVVLFDGTTGKIIKGGGPLGGGAFADFGTGSGDIAEGDHSHSDATDSSPGFMSAFDKDKLDSISTDAEANPEEVSSPEAEAGTETDIRSWSPAKVKESIDALSPITIASYMDEGEVLFKLEGDLSSIPVIPYENLSFDKFAAGDAVPITAEGLKNISEPKSPPIVSDTLDILWDTVDTSLNVYVELDTGEDNLEIRVEELDPIGVHANLRGCRLLIQVHNVDGAEKSIILGTDTGFTDVLLRNGMLAEVAFSGAGSNLFLTGLIGLDGTFVWMDATIPEGV